MKAIVQGSHSHSGLGGASEQAPELPGGLMTVVSTRGGPGLAQRCGVCFRGIFMVDLHDEMDTTVVPISQMAKQARGVGDLQPQALSGGTRLEPRMSNPGASVVSLHRGIHGVTVQLQVLMTGHCHTATSEWASGHPGARSPMPVAQSCWCVVYLRLPSPAWSLPQCGPGGLGL